MSKDYHGNEISVGDTVTKVGSSNEYTVVKTGGGIDGDLIDIDGDWTECGVQPDEVIIQ